MQGDCEDPDAAESREAGGELRVVKRCLRKALDLDDESKNVIIGRMEELVLCISRLMHHGSLLATHYVLDLMERGTPPTDGLLGDQTFFRQCMMYSSSATPAGAYPGIWNFAQRHGALIPDTPLVRCTGNCVNAAARKLMAGTTTMLSWRFGQRVTAAVRAIFPNSPSRTRASVKLRCLGISGGAPTVLGREEWAFVAAVRSDGFGGADATESAIETVVRKCRGVPKAAREAVGRELIAGRMPTLPSIKASGTQMSEIVLALLTGTRVHGRAGLGIG